jgi:hypothetical protein
MTKEMKEIDVEQFHVLRREAGLKIDSETAEVSWTYGQVLDPYGIRDLLPEECYCVGRAYFARAPGSDMWVHFHDLPSETEDALWKKRSKKLATGSPLPFDECPCAPSQAGDDGRRVVGEPERPPDERQLGDSELVLDRTRSAVSDRQ